MGEWFRHDTDARNDIKMRKLTRDHGLAGIGAFWVAVEVLYAKGGEADEGELRDELDFIAPPGMLDVLSDYGLVTVSEGKVTSARVQEEVEYHRECERRRSEAGRIAANARWNRTDANACDGMQTDTNACEAMRSDAIHATIPDHTNKKDISLTKVSSISKEKTVARFVKPTLDEVRAYCSERGNSVDPETFMDFYESKGWKVGNQGMKDWRAAVRTWERSRGGYTPVASQRRKMTTDPEKRGRYVNEDGSIDLLGGMG